MWAPWDARTRKRGVSRVRWLRGAKQATPGRNRLNHGIGEGAPLASYAGMLSSILGAVTKEARKDTTV